MKALVLASGEGERLRPLTDKVNKGMLPVGDKPVLEHIVRHLAEHEFRDIVMAVGVKKEQVKDYFRDGKEFGVRIEYSESSEIQGTAGEIANARFFLENEDDLILYYGDTLTNLDLRSFYDFHKELGGVITGPGMKEIPVESGIYFCHHDGGDVISFHEKPFVNDLISLPGFFSNVPVYCLSNEIWNSDNICFGRDFNRYVVPEFVKEKKVVMFKQEGLWHLDIGDLKKYNLIREAYEKGGYEGLAGLRKLG